MTAAGKILYVGKTKDVLALPRSDFLGFRFKDNILGRNGIPDSGGNEVVGQLAGKGTLACGIACAVFRHLAESGLSTHFMERLTDDSIMVRKTQPVRIEFIYRGLAYGSYLRRHPEVSPLSDISGTRELTLKDDAQDDPLISESDAVSRGLLNSYELLTAFDLLDQVSAALREFFGRHQLRIADFKLEVGRLPGKSGSAGRLMVIDDLGFDNFRIFSESRLLSIQELHAALQLSE